MTKVTIFSIKFFYKMHKNILFCTRIISQLKSKNDLTTKKKNPIFFVGRDSELHRSDALRLIYK